MPGVYEIYVKDFFSAAYALKGYDGNCSRVHGHNWIVEPFFQCHRLKNIGIGIDFKDVRDAVTKLLNKLDHTNLCLQIKYYIATSTILWNSEPSTPHRKISPGSSIRNWENVSIQISSPSQGSRYLKPPTAAPHTGRSRQFHQPAPMKGFT